MSEWRNWAGDQRCTPAGVARPNTVEEVSSIISHAAGTGPGLSPQTVKAVGAGHSFTDIALTNGIQLNLEGLSGLLSVDRENKLATFAAGTRLFQIPALLAPYGLAMTNLGDIDRQSISGAISTGTHGTGLGFGGIATQVAALEIVDGQGQVVRCSATENVDVFTAARVGLGALGIITRVTIACVDAFNLHALERPEPVEAVIESFLDRTRAADHFEFYWFPHSGTALTKTNTRHSPESLPGNLKPLSKAAYLLDDVVMPNNVYGALCEVTAKVPGLIPRVNKIAAKLTGNREFADASNKVFATQRTVKFREMEYAVPLAAVPEIIRELQAMISQRGFTISFPVEVRSAAADTIPLSTANGRETGYIAIHQFIKTNPWEYFSAAEKIFKSYGGRPHWGKMHFLQSKDILKLYPELDFFDRVRNGMDPKRVFRNAYLDRVLP